MRLVVVGASGNVGTAVLRQLVAEPGVDGVVGVARRPPTRTGSPCDLVSWVAGEFLAALAEGTGNRRPVPAPPTPLSGRRVTA